MSILSKPQQEWDDFLEKRSRSGGRRATLLWILIPASILAAALVCFKLLGN